MNRIEFTKEEILDIIQMYQSGKSCLQIKNKYGLKSHQTITNLLRRNGINIRSISETKWLNRASFKYSCNENFFSEINPISSYWAGFIAADGYIGIQKRGGRSRKYLSIEISIKDLKHLERFKDNISSNHPICLPVRNRENGKLDKTCKIRIFSDKITSDLERHFNIVNAKTHTYVPPILDDENMRHFTRGNIDGDGCIKVLRYGFGIEILGTKKHCLIIRDYIRRICKIDTVYTIYKRQGCYGFTFSKYCKDIGRFLIKDTDLFLARKWEKLCPNTN